MNKTTRITGVSTKGDKTTVTLEKGSIEMATAKLRGAEIAAGDEIEVTISLKNDRKLAKGQKIPGQFCKVVSKASAASGPSDAGKAEKPAAESAGEPRSTDYKKEG